jgi:hypothetical protein
MSFATIWNRRAEQKPHRIAVEVDAERFFAHYFTTVGGV